MISKQRVAAILGLGVLATFLILGCAEAPKSELALLMEGKEPPKLSTTQWTNTEGDLPLSWSDLKGKVVVLSFWGTWCPSCRQSVPRLQSMYAEMKDRGLVVLGLHTTHEAAKMPSFVESRGVTYPIAIDKNDISIDRYRVSKFPTLYVIDRKGLVRGVDTPGHQLEPLVNRLLAERA